MRCAEEILFILRKSELRNAGIAPAVELTQ